MGIILVIVWDQEFLGFIAHPTPLELLSQIELSILRMILVQAKGQEKLCSKNTRFFIPMPIASSSILSLVVDQHLLATTDDEPIEDIDPVAPDVDLVAPDIVIDIHLRRLERTRRPAISNDYIVYLQEHEYDMGDVSDLTTYKEAIVSPQPNFWIDTMKDKMTSMSHNKVWSLVDLSDGCKPIGCKWVLKTKRDAKGKVERYKAIIVTKDYNQREGIDFKETFSLVSIMAIVAHFDLELHHMDVRTTFLNEDLVEDVFTSQPIGFNEVGKEHIVCKL